VVKLKKYRKNNIYWRFIQNHHRTLSRTIGKTVKASRRTAISVLIIPPIEFFKKQNIFENHQKFSICSTTKRKGNLSSAFEKANSQRKYIFESWHSRTKTIFKASEKILGKN
jgi:hypothetical protein